MGKRYSVEEIEFIKKQRGRISIKEMTEELNRSYSSIKGKVCKLGLGKNGRVDAPNANISFFEGWSQELAYTVGFFLADGHMTDHSKSGSYSICFSVIDKDIIEKIAKVCEYKNTVKKYINGTSIMYVINISGKSIWKFFESLGFAHNKTFTTRIPKQIPKELMNHFIRGVFDGDGSIIIGNNCYPKVSIVGSELFINDVAKIDIEYGSIAPHSRSFAIRYYGQKAIDFLNYIYKNSTIHMDRKYKRYLKALKWESSYSFWTEQEIELLRETGPITNIDDLTIIFNRSCHSISLKASKLGIRIKEKRNKLWSIDEVKLLKKVYPANSAYKMVTILNRSLNSIQQKAHRIGLKRKYKKEKA